jgi:hypothetical protein
MSFRFRVTKVWHLPQQRVCHVIGVLEEGSILPPVTANVIEHPGVTVQIDSQALGGVLPGGQLTFVAREPTVQPHALEGCILSNT